ncbi:hypothetical protein DSN97_04605 [Deferribacteraceae bacterium V6Fe1]|nr:hypothetical protein DSN97_04605 [Deferribacteraceae bacterium V6Fe1]
MDKIKTRDIVILAVLLIFLVDYVFARYIYEPISQKIKTTKNQIIDVDNQIASNIGTFNNLIKIPEDLKRLRKSILEQKIKNILLHEKVKTADEVSDILKTFLLESGIDIDKVSLTSSNITDGVYTYEFQLNFKTNSLNLVRFIDKVENTVSFMDISSYSIKNGTKYMDVSMSIKSKYLGKQ